jgi:hypothetical protein
VLLAQPSDPEMLPAHEVNADAQITMRFRAAVNLHQPWEMVHAWGRRACERAPVVLVLRLTFGAVPIPVTFTASCFLAAARMGGDGAHARFRRGSSRGLRLLGRLPGRLASGVRFLKRHLTAGGET